MSAATESVDASDSALQAENMSNDNASFGPINREPTPPVVITQRLEQEGIDQSKDITFLTTCGIKVRDFAYESTLPPVTIVPRFAVQTQPRPRTLKRTRDVLEGYDDGEESDVEDPSIYRTWYIDSSGTGMSCSSRYRKKTQALARTLTEPADDVPPSQGFNTREGGLTILPSQRPTSPVPPSQPAQCPTTPHRPNRHAQATSLSPLTIVDNVSPSQASGQGESQETDPWIDTPLVTPNGSLQWPIVQDTSTMPASQLKSILPQLPADDDVTFSQLGFSPERSQPQHRAAPIAPSPAGTPSRRRVHDPQLPPPAAFRCRTPSPAKSRHASGSPRRSPRSDGAEARQGPPEPRYHLRQRPPGGLNANTTNAGRGAPSASRRATSSSRSASQSARKMENAVPPVRKKQKPSPPADTPGRTTGNGRRKNADVEGIR